MPRSIVESDFVRGVPVLVTGGAGFIGSHLAARLLSLGAEVRILDDLSGGSRDNVPADAKLIPNSILDQPALREAIRDCRFVFHQAAMVSVPESVEHPDRCLQINTVGTQRVLEAAHHARVQRVMFAASAAAYGASPRLPSRETDPVDCVSPYAASKVAGEALLRSFACCYGLSTVSLRYFNIFGPRQNPNSAYAAVISAFTSALRAGRSPTVHGDGRQTRDFTFVENVVDANLLAAASPRDLRGEVINVGTGRQTSLLDVLEQLGRTLGNAADISAVFGPPRPGDVRNSVADISRAQEWLNYQPRIDLAEGLARTVGDTT